MNHVHSLLEQVAHPISWSLQIYIKMFSANRISSGFLKSLIKLEVVMDLLSLNLNLLIKFQTYKNFLNCMMIITVEKQ